MVLCNNSSFFTGGFVSLSRGCFPVVQFTSDRYLLTIAARQPPSIRRFSKFLDIFLKIGLRGRGLQKPERFSFNEAFLHTWWVTRVEVRVLKSFCSFVMCLQNQRLSLFPLLVHGSIGTGNDFSVNISWSISLKYLVCIGAFSPGGTPSYKLQKYQRPKGRVFAQGREGELIRISSDRDDRMGPKIKTQKNPQGFQLNPPKKIRGPKISPKEIPCRISEP